LGVHIKNEHFSAFFGEAHCEIYCGCCLSDSAFLVYYADLSQCIHLFFEAAKK
jgi:hypothetical protein